MHINIIVTTQFEAIHCWPQCPFNDVAFLRAPHRHIFHVTMKWKVMHTNRDVEFIRMKREVDVFIKNTFKGKDLGLMSCEDIAVKLQSEFLCNYVSIFEDNENGAEITI